MTHTRPDDGNALDAIVHATVSDAGRVFRGKPFEDDPTMAGLKVRLGVFAKANGARHEHETFTLTGRKIWAFAGRGNAHEGTCDTCGALAYVSYWDPLKAELRRIGG